MMIEHIVEGYDCLVSFLGELFEFRLMVDRNGRKFFSFTRTTDTKYNWSELEYVFKYVNHILEQTEPLAFI